MALFYSHGLDETRDIENPEEAIDESKDEVIRDGCGRILQVTPQAKNPKYKGFLTTWVRLPFPPITK